MKTPQTQTTVVEPSGSACRFRIVATTDKGIRTFEGNASANPGQRATLDELLIGLISGVVREEKLALLGITVEASLASPNADVNDGARP